MPPNAHCYFQQATRRFVVWCLLVAVPVFGVSGTLVEMLGANHAHRAAATLLSQGGGDVMHGWVDMRRASVAAGAPRGHSHAHSLFARHHHDHDDASVIALDGGLLQGEASDDGGASNGSLSHIMALTDLASFALLSVSRFAWLDAAAAAAMPWTADGPMRPPKA